MKLSGPGGQSVNTTDSAVRVTHIPTGTVVICQNEKSQHKNKASALRVLRSCLLEAELAKQEEFERDQRRDLVKSGDRSDKIRTYNLPQDRITDHRINLSKRNLKSVLDGEITELIVALRAHAQAEALTTDNKRLSPLEANLEAQLPLHSEQGLRIAPGIVHRMVGVSGIAATALAIGNFACAWQIAHNPQPCGRLGSRCFLG